VSDGEVLKQIATVPVQREPVVVRAELGERTKLSRRSRAADDRIWANAIVRLRRWPAKSERSFVAVGIVPSDTAQIEKAVVRDARFRASAALATAASGSTPC
jgi:hypothetical protein